MLARRGRTTAAGQCTSRGLRASDKTRTRVGYNAAVTRALHEQNRKSWNHATVAHNSHKGNQAAFLRGGGSTLFPEELELLGDLTHQRLVHLQCNAGQDTLSLAARGAIVTGVDISDEAIAFATRLSADSGIPASFERADVYDWLEAAPRGSFDRGFSSYGAVVWLSDLPAWARGIARVLAPGGRMVLMEFHPVSQLPLPRVAPGSPVASKRPVSGSTPRSLSSCLASFCCPASSSARAGEIAGRTA